MNIRRLLPLEWNLVIKNLRNFTFQKEYEVIRTDEKPICFYLDAASYNNLGDQAIAFAIECFLDDVFGKKYVKVINETDLITYIRSLKKQITPRDIIVLSGGGNMGDLYPRYESLRRLVIKLFSNNRIIVFPQTIDYTITNYGRREFQRALHVYKEHKALYMFVREEKSYNLLKHSLKSLSLVPDIVYYLCKDNQSKSKRKNNQIGLCLRKDSESILSEDDKNSLESTIISRGYQVAKLSTLSDRLFIGDFETRRELLQKKWNEFGECECVITDRLHGMVFCAIANVPCLIIDNTNHKVMGVYETVSDYADGIEHLDSLDEILDKIDNIKNKRMMLDSSQIDYHPIVKALKGV